MTLTMIIRRGRCTFAFLLSMTYAVCVAEAATVQSMGADVTAEVVAGQPRVTVRVTNRGKQTIEAWQIRLIYVDALGLTQSIDITSDAYAVADDEKNGPIRPGTARVESFAVSSPPKSAEAEIRMVIFSDMSSRGDVAELQAVVSRRQQHAKALEILSGVLQAASGLPSGQGRTQLENALSSRTAELSPYLNDALIKGHFETLKGLTRGGDDASFDERRAILQKQFNSQRQLAMRQQRPR